MFRATTATKKIQSLKKRIRAIQGGTSASKTISTLLVLIDMSQRDTTPKLASIVSESLPHLKRGAMKDFLQIMQEHGYYKDDLWNKSDFTYTFETGSKIEFFSADQPSKVRGPRRDRLFMNECNNMPYETFDQLEVRTKEVIFLDWNPTVEFWYYNQVAPRDDVDFLIVTYKDNEALNEAIVRSIEQRKNNKEWWKVYGEGQLGEVETRIYKGWPIIDDIPFGAELVRYWLDFGYSNDPTSIGSLYKYDGGYIVDEIAYQKGMLNKHIADTILVQEQKALTVGDSSEPKSIDEIRLYGVNIVPAIKGSGSVNKGIQVVQGLKVSMTKRSTNIIKEYRNYVWITDKDGKIINEPLDVNNHAMDGIRYAVNSLFMGSTQAKQFVPNHVGGARRGFYNPN